MSESTLRAQQAGPHCWHVAGHGVMQYGAGQSGTPTVAGVPLGHRRHSAACHKRLVLHESCNESTTCPREVPPAADTMPFSLFRAPYPFEGLCMAHVPAGLLSRWGRPIAELQLSVVRGHAEVFQCCVTPPLCESKIAASATAMHTIATWPLATASVGIAACRWSLSGGSRYATLTG